MRSSAGATLLCSAAEDPADTLDFIERERPELTNGFVASIAPLVAHPSFASRDFSSIRSGNLYPLSPEGVRPADPELRHNMLGMTETGSVCLMDPDESDQPEHRRGSFGRPVPGLATRVVDPETLADVAPGEMGELWFRGPALMEGYDGRERFEVFTADEWFRTGDLFTVDGDGCYYFHGRRGDMIKTAGANVSPKEVEAALRDVTGGLGGPRHRVARRGARRDRRGGGAGREGRRARPGGPAEGAPHAPVGVQGAATVRGRRARRPAHAPGRQTRPPHDRGALR